MVLVERPEGNRPLERSRRSWNDDIKMDPKETGLLGMDPGHGPVADFYEYGNEYFGSIKLWEIVE